MSTSLTDARYTSIHFTDAHLLSLEIDDPPETGWSVMPGFDESIPIPLHLEPPTLDADETLPSQLHPSYPFGRPPSKNKPIEKWVGPRNLLGTVGDVGLSGSSNGGSGGTGGAGGWTGGAGGEWLGSTWGRGERWDELGMRGIVENEKRKEIPPGMAGAKRPPSPPSPQLRPSAVRPPRSIHLQHLQDRQRQAEPQLPSNTFDAPVPNETFQQEGDHRQGDGGQVEGIEGMEGTEAMESD